jgi:putative tricarboxylic transport membrane protein
MRGFDRFTLGSLTLADGLGIIPVSVGMFGMAELLTNAEIMAKQEVFKTDLRNLFPSLKDWYLCRWAVIRGTLVGFLLGIFPGAATVLPTFYSYALEKRFSKYPEKFGTGVIEGVAGPETANNAASTGSMVPLFALGIPPSVVMAMLLGAFIIHGIQPGPFFISDHPKLFWGIIASMYVGNMMLLILNLPLIGMWIQILKVPYRLLFPLITIFCFIGVYTGSNNFYELIIMVFFGFLGYVFRKIEYEAGPFIMAMVLGPMMETSLRQSMTISMGDPAVFFKRPISAGLLILVFVMVVYPPLLKTLRKGRSMDKEAG